MKPAPASSSASAPAGEVADEARFARQRAFAPLGAAGQERLQRARVLIVGLGALGSHAAQSLARAGVGELVLADRDLVEPSNLARQVLYEPRHAQARVPKVAAAAEMLERLGGPTRLEPHALHVDAENLPRLALGCALVLDGTDNLATRYLLNDHAVERGQPWIHAAAVGSQARALAVLPGDGPCLCCLYPDPPPPEALPSCESAGVLEPAAAAAAALQCGLALRVLGGVPPGESGHEPLRPALLALDVWSGALSRLAVQRDPDCRCCGAREFRYLEAGAQREPLVLCGRNAVQIPGRERALELEALALRLVHSGVHVERLSAFLRFAADGARFSVFADGRALIEGTDDPLRARSLYERWVGA
jgi:molybdopterin/thiamine biosynthesis adenylyltransferase